VLADDVRLPRRQSEGEMPHIALTSGCDPVGCALRKIGIDMSELGTSANPTRAVHVFDGSPWVGGGAWPKAQILWKDPSLMKTYDQVIFSGECLPMLDTKGAPGQEAFQVVTEYLASGGRILTTGSMFNWYKLSSDPLLASVAVIPGPGGATQGGEQAIAIDSGFPKGKALAEWLFNLYPTMVKGKPTGFSWVYDNISSVDGAKAQVWGVGPGGTKPRIFSVNTPVGKPVATQCGKAVHVDAHVSVDTSMDASFTTSPLACNGPMDARFAVVAFFLFDNVACIQKEGDAPVSPPTK
jgi:hypothetical protein